MQVTISDAIRYIGVDDKDIDLFESQYVVPEGVSYNSYVILDEKIAVMDTVDARGMEGWEDKLLQTLNGKKPDYLISGGKAGCKCKGDCDAATVLRG